MALVKCPECGRENVSNTASVCPDCGFNIKDYFENRNLEIKEQRLKTLTKELSEIQKRQNQIKELHVNEFLNDYIEQSIPIVVSKRIGVFTGIEPQKPSKQGGLSGILAMQKYKRLMREYNGNLENYNAYKKKQFKVVRSLIKKAVSSAIRIQECECPACDAKYGFVLSDNELKLGGFVCEKYLHPIPNGASRYSFAEEEIMSEIRAIKSADSECAQSKPPHTLKCPFCGSTNVSKLGLVNKSISVGMAGLASSKIGKQWHCNNCKSNF